MIETVDFRADRSLARKYLGKNIGKPLSDITVQIITRTDGELCAKILKIEKRLEQKGSSFCGGGDVTRRYTSSEIQSAELLTFRITRLMHASGMETGTVYDESKMCQKCASGRRRVGPLILDLRRAPKTSGFAVTYDREWIVSEELAQAFVDTDVTGCELRPVRHKTYTEDETIKFDQVPTGRKLLERFKKSRLATWKFCFWLNDPKNKEGVRQAQDEWRDYLQLREKRKRTPYPRWYELIVTSNLIRIVEPSRWGISLFDPDIKGEYRCPQAGKRDHVAGLNLVSEAHAAKKDWDGSDLCRSTQLESRYPNPTPVLFMSQKLKQILDKHAKRSFYFEVAYLK